MNDTLTNQQDSIKVLPAKDSLPDIKAFIPKGFVLFEKIYGDLNNDGLGDYVLMIKGTDTSRFVDVEYRGSLDRNRRGLVVLFNRNNTYEKVFENDTCFSSENEDGGVYFPPELSVNIEKGNLYVNYGHGRYGHWQYTFRYQNSDFELIGYDGSECMGPRVDIVISINYLTGKKIKKVNTNEDCEGGEEVYKTSVKYLKQNKLLRLSEIKDFDEIYIPGEE